MNNSNVILEILGLLQSFKEFKFPSRTLPSVPSRKISFPASLFIEPYITVADLITEQGQGKCLLSTKLDNCLPLYVNCYTLAWSSNVRQKKSILKSTLCRHSVWCYTITARFYSLQSCYMWCTLVKWWMCEMGSFTLVNIWATLHTDTKLLSAVIMYYI